MTEKGWTNDPAFRCWFHENWARLRACGKALGKESGTKRRPPRGGNYVYTPWQWKVK